MSCAAVITTVSLSPTISNNTYTASADLTGLDYQNQYNISVSVVDKLSSVTKTVTVKKGIPVFDWGESDFAFHVPVNFEKGGTGFAPAGYGLGQTNGQYCYDCNQALAIGFYTMAGSGCVNIPNDYYFGYGVLEVDARYGDVYQTIRYRDMVATRYGIRDESNIGTVGSWSAWEYVIPPMKIGVEYRTTERWNGAPVYVKLVDCGNVAATMNVNTGISNARAVRASITWANMQATYHDYTTTSLNSWDFIAYTNVSSVIVKAGPEIVAATGKVYATIWYAKYADEGALG